METDPLSRFRIAYARSIEQMASRGHADRWGLDIGVLAAALHESVAAWANRLAAPQATETVAKYLDGLNAEDLVLACACRAGIPRAWEHFVAQYRGILTAAARALVHDEALARDLADSLYADLYGLEERAGQRRSLLAYFHGRSSLQTWLKTVIAQRFFDDYRAHQRTAAIGQAFAREQALPDTTAGEDPPEPERERYVEALGDAIAKALAELNPRDRMRLNFHYLEGLTLKEIGGIMDEYESTVSRRLARTRRQLRKRVEQFLRRDKRLSEEQIRLCYDYAIEAWPAVLGPVLPGSVK